MAWLAENWIYLLAFVGVLLFLRFGGMGCGFGGRRTRGGHTHHGADDANPNPSTELRSATDPISGRPVDPRSAVATLYGGQAYYFESRENRDRFEANPAAYAGHAAGSAPSAERRHHGGCC